MSQHHFFTLHAGRKTHILMGWDRPLQGFFLVIQKETDQEDYFWSNLDDETLAESHPKKLIPFLKKLLNFNIKIPQQMVDEINDDKYCDIGNKNVIHQFTSTGYYRIEEYFPVQDFNSQKAYDLYMSQNLI